jgi:hypothetical protein
MGSQLFGSHFTNLLTLAALDATQVLLFDAASGSLAALDFLKQDLQQLLEPSSSPLTTTGSTSPHLCALLPGSLLQLLTVTYEENLTGTFVSSSTSHRSSSILASSRGPKQAMRTSLKRYETNEDFLKALFIDEGNKLVLEGGGGSSGQGEDEID